MRIALDIMGGDYAPGVNIEGAFQAAKEIGKSVVLIGNESLIREQISKYPIKGLPLEVVHASEVIGVEEKPILACRQKKDSSIVIGTRYLAEGKIDGLVSAGNSGAIMTSALMYLKKLPGVLRPAIATLMPTLKGTSVMIDVGANVDSKPEHLLQFAIMGEIFVRCILKKESPRVGLLSIGLEEQKGNELSLATYKLLKKSKLNFIGNVEGGDILHGGVDVVVCDGFVGNILLKFAEGLGHTIMGLLKQEFKKSLFTTIVAWASKIALGKCLKDFRKRIDYDEYGGAPLLGIDGVCIICHGRSNAKAIKNAIRVAGEYFFQNINQEIKREIKLYEQVK